MDYYRLLDFHTEPFSNSPDPGFFFGSSSHLDCLQKLEISIRLKRGLCVVMGEVGAGKTTICRKLIRDLKDDPDIEAHLVLDPSFMSSLEMLGSLNRMMRKAGPGERAPSSEAGYKELIKNHLFQKVVQEEKSVVLIVDEGQKISSSCLEVLRELLNFETNEHKLLQIIIFAQNEFQDTLSRHSNFADRISLFYHICPLNLKETRDLIRFRLDKAADYSSSRRPQVSFSSGAYRKIHRITNGHPRKIINICHQLLMLLIVTNRQKVTAAMVRKAGLNLTSIRKRSFFKRRAIAGAAASLFIMVVVFGYLLYPGPGDFFQAGLSTSPGHEQEKSASYVRMKLDPMPEAETADIVHSETMHAGQEVLLVPEKQRPEKKEDLLKQDETWPIIPEELGRIKVRRNENLWIIISRVYGRATVNLLDRVEVVNPHVRNINRLYEGQMIFMPVRNAAPPSPEEAFWITLKSFTELEPAYSDLVNTDKDRLRILSYIRPDSGPLFAVAWPRSFSSEKSAREEMGNMPADMRDSAEILHLDSGDILLF
jgi:general secretion pathway protein A